MNLFDSLSQHWTGMDDGANTCLHATSSCHIQLGSGCWARLLSVQCGHAADLAAKQQKLGPRVCRHNLSELLRISQTHDHINRHTHARRVDLKGAGGLDGDVGVGVVDRGASSHGPDTRDHETGGSGGGALTWSLKPGAPVEWPAEWRAALLRVKPANFTADRCAKTANCDPGTEQNGSAKLH